MAEEKKSQISKVILKVVAGAVLIILGAIALYYWWIPFLTILKGIVGVILILAGLVFFAITKS
jgi:CHASE2 domain-containing sensor protein